jgi:hypothetical protein
MLAEDEQLYLLLRAFMSSGVSSGRPLKWSSGAVYLMDSLVVPLEA